MYSYDSIYYIIAYYFNAKASSINSFYLFISEYPNCAYEFYAFIKFYAILSDVILFIHD